MLAPAARPFNRPGWIFELKYDGFRVLAGTKDKNRISFLGAVTIFFRAIPRLGPVSWSYRRWLWTASSWCSSRSDFETLRRRLALRRPTSVECAARRTPAAIFAFDLLELRGKDLRALPLLRRKQSLKEELRGAERIRYLDYAGESGHRLFQFAEELGLERIVAKHGGARYRRGRASGWIKVKTATGRAIDAERAKWND